MASETDIGNLALAHLGDDANLVSVDPPDGSPQADHIARFYPIARDSLLEMHAWSFASTTRELVEVDYEVDGWDYVYAIPNLCLRPRGIYIAGGRNEIDDPILFELEIRHDTDDPVLLTSAEGAILRYTKKVTDTTRFTPLFVDALSWMLASMVAGPLIKGESGVAAAKECWNKFVERFAAASEADANKARARLNHTPGWIGARG